MSSQFQIDGATVKDPIEYTYADLYNVGKDYMGIYVTSAFYEATATFNTLTTAEHSAWMAADDGQAHSIRCPEPGDPSTFTTFTGVIIRNLSSGISNGLYFYGVQFNIKRINILGLPEFGA